MYADALWRTLNLSTPSLGLVLVLRRAQEIFEVLADEFVKIRSLRAARGIAGWRTPAARVADRWSELYC
jgi:hypothetical protein